MKTFLFISEVGQSLSIAKRIQDEGNNVSFYINDVKSRDLGEGIVTKSDVESILCIENLYDPSVFKELLKCNPDIAIFDFSFHSAPSLKTEFEKKGVSVYGASLLAKSSCINRDYMVKVLETNAINSGNDIKGESFTYSTMISGKKRIASFISFNYNHLMNDDIGPRCRMGNVSYHGDLDLLDTYFEQMVSSLSASGFSGKIDFEMTVNEKTITCNGVSFYFGMNIYSFLENINIPIGELLYSCSINEEISLKSKSLWSSQINCNLPPFPYEVEWHGSEDIKGVNSENLKHIWANTISKNGATYSATVDSGELLSVTGRGNYSREAKRRAYRTISNLSVPNLMYRTDIGLDIVERCNKLASLGWLSIEDDNLIEPFKAKPLLAVDRR